MADELERRSNRRRNAVCYQQALTLGSDDDDFADPPPSKKLRSEKTTSKSNHDKPAKSTTRLSRDEKLYNRSIEQALKKSKPPNNNLSDIQTSSDDVAPSDTLSSSEDYSDEASEDSDFCSSPAVKIVSRKKESSKKNIATKTAGPKKSKNAASSKPKVETVLQASTIPKDGLTNPVSIVPPTEPLTPGHQQKTTSAIHPAPIKLTKPISTTNLSTPKSELSFPAANKTPPVGKFPKWTPPSKATKGGMITDVRSTSSVPGGSPVIRLGLSRHAKIKPLHKHRT